MRPNKHRTNQLRRRETKYYPYWTAEHSMARLRELFAISSEVQVLQRMIRRSGPAGLGLIEHRLDLLESRAGEPK